MKSIENNRIFAFDQLRAIMMMLGIVIHAGCTYITRDISETWPVKDVHSTSLVFEVIVGFVHSFRMPLFFVVSGFFTSMIFFVRGPGNMLRNRVKRIIYPLIAGIIILCPVDLLVVNLFLSKQGREIEPVINIITKAGLNISIDHLWFIYYLAMFCITAWAVAISAQLFPKFNQQCKTLFGQAFRSAWAPFLFAPFTMLCLGKSGAILINDSDILAFDFDCYISHGYFFWFGWMVFLHKDQLSRFMKQDKLLLAAGTALFFVMLVLIVFFPELEKSKGIMVYYVINAISAWCFIFGFTGLALRFLNQYSAFGQYMSDASYWVYLVHLPLVIYFQGMLVPWHVQGLVKFFIVVIATSLMSLLSYHFFVRNSFIGRFLSGNKKNI
jgi:glucan biosynthesis protein C